ncbi:MAG: DUF4304 domain-containing protein [Pseudolysinimonas sp.]
MSPRNVVQTTFDEFGKSRGGAKKSGSWYLQGSDTIAVLNLQKSQFGLRYYGNVALWFLGIGVPSNPKPSHCHVQTRLESLVPADQRARLEELLDLEVVLGEDQRHDELLAVLEGQLGPILDASQTLAGLASEPGQHLLKKSLIDGDGQRFLKTRAEGS